MNDHWPDPRQAQEVAHLQQTVVLLEQRLEEQQAETRHWLEVVRRQGAVISAARAVTAAIAELDAEATT